MGRMKDLLTGDLFDHRDYPDAPGYKDTTTSLEAAVKIETRAGTLRYKVWKWFEAGNTGTADEVADVLGESVLAIRPRLSELHANGAIVTTGARRKNKSGMSAHVWRRSSL